LSSTCFLPYYRWHLVFSISGTEAIRLMGTPINDRIALGLTRDFTELASNTILDLNAL
jgi:hypothetical protein